MGDSTQPSSDEPAPTPDRDTPGAGVTPDGGWIARAVRARTHAELTAVAREARAAGTLTPRDQQWCRALSAYLTDQDVAAMRELVHLLGASAVTGNGSDQ